MSLSPARAGFRAGSLGILAPSGMPPRERSHGWGARELVPAPRKLGKMRAEALVLVLNFAFSFVRLQAERRRWSEAVERAA